MIIMINFLVSSVAVLYLFMNIYFLQQFLDQGRFKKTAIAMTFLLCVGMVMGRLGPAL